MNPETMNALEAAAPNLAARDASFAYSLLAQWKRTGALSEKQAPWPAKLLARLSGAGDRRATAPVGNLSGVLGLFDRAAKHLKRPAIVLTIAGQQIKFTIASGRAAVPGSVNVATADRGEWFGRILRNGTFEASFKTATPAGLVDGLQAFAASPATVAAEHGRLTGRCCFCNLALKDERSTAVGYGRTCADHFGLAWGAAKHKFTA